MILLSIVSCSESRHTPETAAPQRSHTTNTSPKNDNNDDPILACLNRPPVLNIYGKDPCAPVRAADARPTPNAITAMGDGASSRAEKAFGFGAFGAAGAGRGGRGVLGSSFGGGTFDISKKMIRKSSYTHHFPEKTYTLHTDPAARRTPQHRPQKSGPSQLLVRERIDNHPYNRFVSTQYDNLSTFAVDVDTASYSIARSQIRGYLGNSEHIYVPPRMVLRHGDVRTEEFMNAFTYGYAPPQDQAPFQVHFEGAPSPFNAKYHFIRIGLQGRRIEVKQRKPAHLTFLIDVSGSMLTDSKLKRALKALTLLVQELHPQDTVAISTYAGHVKQVLPPTPAKYKNTILQTLHFDDLHTSEQTAMSDGLELAYSLASKSFQKGHINRVIVLSDGDANVGATSHEQILKRISKYTKKGITLSTIGFADHSYNADFSHHHIYGAYRGYNDHMMEQLANKGNGNYYFIDSLKEAKKVFIRNLTGTLQVIAKDVKTQVEFNPQEVASYRLIGYENRDVADEDFRNDKVDAGEIGAGHQVTAIYEIRLRNAQPSQHIATVRLRHKTPTGTQATESKTHLTAQHIKPSYKDTSTSYKLAFSSMAFAEKLRNSPYATSWSFARILQLLPSNGVPNMNELRELRALIQAFAPPSPKNIR